MLSARIENAKSKLLTFTQADKEIISLYHRLLSREYFEGWIVTFRLRSMIMAMGESERKLGKLSVKNERAPAHAKQAKGQSAISS